jgi:predicted kinase
MKTVYLTKGCSGSGKSTWAKELVQKNPNSYKRVNKDDLRAMIDCGYWSPKAEELIKKVRDSIILLALEAGKNVVVDDTHLAGNHIEHIKELVKGKAIVEIVDHFLQVPIEECIKNDLKRLNSVGEAVIRRQYNDYFKKTKEVIKVPYDSSLKDVIICDIDGTLAHMKDRSPFDWKRVGEDTCDQTIKGILEVYRDNEQEYCTDLKIVIMSGRDSICRPETEAWLASNKIPYDMLYMRSQGDTRKDTIIKEELYKEHIEGKYNVLFVLDDRQMVVDHWRKLGLKCLQVQEGNF